MADSPFTPASPADVVRLIADYPLAWVISRDFQATPLPLLAETDRQGKVKALFGHFALRNPQVSALQKDPQALILFGGPQGYISPTLVSNPTWGPTWNYAVARFTVRVEFAAEENDRAIALLAKHVEPEGHWAPGAMGVRYGQLIKHIVAFRAHVEDEQATFKLGQDEAPGTFAEIVDGLGDVDLGHWMMTQKRAT